MDRLEARPDGVMLTRFGGRDGVMTREQSKRRDQRIGGLLAMLSCRETAISAQQ